MPYLQFLVGFCRIIPSCDWDVLCFDDVPQLLWLIHHVHMRWTLGAFRSVCKPFVKKRWRNNINRSLPILTLQAFWFRLVSAEPTFARMHTYICTYNRTNMAEQISKNHNWTITEQINKIGSGLVQDLSRICSGLVQPWTDNIGSGLVQMPYRACRVCNLPMQYRYFSPLGDHQN